MPGGTMNGNTVAFDLFDSDPNNAKGNFTYFAQSATIPKATVNKANIPYFGTDFRVPTTIQYGHDWSIEFLLEENMDIYERLRRWMRMFSDLRLSGGGYKLIPNINMRIRTLGSKQQFFVNTYVVAGVWPTGLTDIKLAYKQNDTSVLKCSLRLKYQYCYDEAKGDPLQAVAP